MCSLTFRFAVSNCYGLKTFFVDFSPVGHSYFPPLTNPPMLLTVSTILSVVIINAYSVSTSDAFGRNVEELYNSLDSLNITNDRRAKESRLLHHLNLTRLHHGTALRFMEMEAMMMVLMDRLREVEKKPTEELIRQTEEGLRKEIEVDIESLVVNSLIMV